MSTPVEHCASGQQWRGAIEQAVAGGWDYLEMWAATDWGSDQRHVCAVLRAIEPREDAAPPIRGFSVTVPADSPVPTLADLWPVATWYEQEGYEQVGITTDRTAPGGRGPSTPGRLLREQPLSRRVSNEWPGHYDPAARPGGRRRPRPVPGVWDEWVRDDDTYRDRRDSGRGDSAGDSP